MADCLPQTGKGGTMPDMNVSKEKTNPPIAVLFEVLCFFFLFAISPALSSELIEINGRFYDCDRQYRVEQNGSTVYLVTETAGSWELDEGDLKAFKPGDTGFYYTEIDSNPPYILTDNKWRFDIQNPQAIENIKRIRQQDLERASSKEWADSVNMRVRDDAQWQPLREKVNQQIAEKKRIEAERQREKAMLEHEKEMQELKIEEEKAKRPIIYVNPPTVNVW